MTEKQILAEIKSLVDFGTQDHPDILKQSIEFTTQLKVLIQKYGYKVILPCGPYQSFLSSNGNLFNNKLHITLLLSVLRNMVEVEHGIKILNESSLNCESEPESLPSSTEPLSSEPLQF